MSDEREQKARAYPLQWPVGRPRAKQRQGAAFSTDGGRRRLRPYEGARRALDELGRLGARNIVVSTNIRPKGLGDDFAEDFNPNDPGAAVYFLLDGKQHCMACDKWDRVADNLAAIAAHVEAVRGQLRWGVADAAQAFAGFRALPPVRMWWEILGVPRSAPLEQIRRRRLELAALHHPDRGGNSDKMAEVNEAWEQMERERDPAPPAPAKLEPAR